MGMMVPERLAMPDASSIPLKLWLLINHTRTPTKKTGASDFYAWMVFRPDIGRI
jgi:hypothetical protein